MGSGGEVLHGIRECLGSCSFCCGLFPFVQSKGFAGAAGAIPLSILLFVLVVVTSPRRLLAAVSAVVVVVVVARSATSPFYFVVALILDSRFHRRAHPFTS